MEIERKLNALKRIYAVYDEFIRTQPTACRMYCHLCCTTHVTVTSLEVYNIFEALPSGEREKLLHRVSEASEFKRFQPAVTTNSLAELCEADQEPPAENETFTNDTCPLLVHDLCSIYALRPFNCRCFISRTACEGKGYADLEEAVFAVNTIFLQTIEHVDADGCSGNLLDMLKVLGDEEKRKAYAVGVLHCTGNGLIVNRPLKVLMAPPERRETIEPILKKLRGIRV
jgi:Fe-S-cluster containining protein